MSEEKLTIIDLYRKGEAWSSYLEKEYGLRAAISFSVGTDLLLEMISDDLEALSSLPAGSHIGQLDESMLVDIMPEQFLMRYDYEFLYTMRSTVDRLRMVAHHGGFQAHSVLEELCIYLAMTQASMLRNDDQIRKLIQEEEARKCQGVDPMEYEENGGDHIGDDHEWDSWAFILFQDDDVVMLLYSGLFPLTPDNSYHFDHWLEDQFFVSAPEE